MIKLDGAVWRATAALVVSVVLAGCRETEPEPAHNLDLGDGRMVLMPPASEWSSSAIAKGQADWHPFRDPAAERSPSAAESDDAEGGGAISELETDIRELIAEYNEVAMDGTVEDLLDYFVEEQYEKLNPILALTIKYRDVHAGLRAALESRLPDDQEQVVQIMGAMALGLIGAIDVREFKVISDTDVTVTSAFAQYRFTFIDEDWYVEIGQFDQYAAAQRPRLEQAIEHASDWLSALESDQWNPMAILGQIEQAAQAQVDSQAAASGEAENTPVGSEKPEEGDDSGGG